MAEIKTTEKQKDTLAGVVLDRYRRAKEYRGTHNVHQGMSFETLFERAEHQYRREYTTADAADMQTAFGFVPTRYYGVTQQKVNATVAWANDLVINNLDSMFTATPSPEPELDKASLDRIRDSVREDLVRRMIASGISDPNLLLTANGRPALRVENFLQEQVRALKQVERSRIIGLASESAERAQTRMRDLMIQGNFRQAYTSYTFERALYGVGYIRFPDWQSRPVLKHKGKKAAMQWETVPWFRNVRVRDFFPICDAIDLQTNTGNTERTCSCRKSSTRGRNHFYKLFKAYENVPGAFCEHLSAADTGIFTPIQLALERKVYIDLYGAALGNSLFEQEYLSSWDAAVIGAVFGTEIKLLRAQGRALPLRYDPRYPVDTSWDIGVGDTNVILFWQRVGNFERLFDWYAGSDTGIEHYAEILRGKPYFYGNHIGPHDIQNREWGTNGVGRMATAKKFGIHFKRMDNYSKQDSIACGSRLVNMMQVNVSDEPVEDPMDDCAFVLEALAEYHFKFDRERKVMSKNPEHDWTSHYADSFMTRGLFVAQDTTLGRPLQASLQGNNVDPTLLQYDNQRLRDIFARQSNKRRGAWG